MKKLVLFVLISACKSSASGPPGPPPGQTAASLAVTSAGFGANAPIPLDNTCDGSDLSPQINWSTPPDKTKSIAVIVDDPDAAGHEGGTYTHWILWNVKGDTQLIGAGGNGGYSGGIAGTNDFGKLGYSGPCPPKGSTHHYHFRIYALDVALTLKPSDKRADLDHAMNGHVIAQGDLVGIFTH